MFWCHPPYLEVRNSRYNVCLCSSCDPLTEASLPVNVSFNCQGCCVYYNSYCSDPQLNFVLSFTVSWCLTLPLRMICFLWKWEVSCITSVSRELSKCSDWTAMSPTACVVGHLMRCGTLKMIKGVCVWHSFSNALLDDDILFSSSVSLSTEQYFSSRDFPVDQP